MGVGPSDAVTVVIPAFNAAATIREQLQALDAQTFHSRFDVIVVDNASTDATALVVHDFTPRDYDLSLVAELRRGVNYARNAGVCAAEPGIVLLCDADDTVGPTWLEALTRELTPRTWVVGSVDYLHFNSEGTRELWNVGSTGTPRLAEPYVDTTFGGNCAFHRSMWSEVGGFDERLSGKGDENEMFMRAYRAGYRPVLAPDAVVHYRLRPGRRAFMRVRFRQGRQQVAVARMIRSSQSTEPTPRSVLRDLARLAAASPKYATPRRARFVWLGAASRHAGRLVERLRPTVTEPRAAGHVGSGM